MNVPRVPVEKIACHAPGGVHTGHSSLDKAAARTVEALEDAIASALNTFQPDECANFFAHAGYDLD